MPRFEVGDRVICIDNFESDEIKGRTGTIVKIRSYSIGVDFDKWFTDGHSCDGLARRGHGWFVEARCLKLEVKKPKVLKQYGIVKWMEELKCEHSLR